MNKILLKQFLDVKRRLVENKSIIIVAPYFTEERLKDGYYKIICKGTNQVLTVKDDKVVQSKDVGSDNQKWEIETAKDGYFFIKSKSTSLYLDIPGGISKNGNIIEVHKKNGSNAQMFNL